MSLNPKEMEVSNLCHMLDTSGHPGRGYNGKAAVPGSVDVAVGGVEAEAGKREKEESRHDLPRDVLSFPGPCPSHRALSIGNKDKRGHA